MMYSEFIDRTGFGEKYMTFDDYQTYIEPVYVDCKDDKDKFCKKFYKLHNINVNTAVDNMFRGKEVDELELYLNDEKELDDIEKAHELIKKGFLKNLKYIYK